jgi:hypothetical protein
LLALIPIAIIIAGGVAYGIFLVVRNAGAAATVTATKPVYNLQDLGI